MSRVTVVGGYEVGTADGAPVAPAGSVVATAVPLDALAAPVGDPAGVAGDPQAARTAVRAASIATAGRGDGRRPGVPPAGRPGGGTPMATETSTSSQAHASRSADGRNPEGPVSFETTQEHGFRKGTNYGHWWVPWPML